MTTYVLVPGACHGGWCYDDLAATLRDGGHDVVAITLTALGGGGGDPLATTLSDHVDDVVRVLDQRDLHDVVLTGHNYAGMVITGAADRRPERIHTLAYLDAFVPVDGDTVETLINNEMRAWCATGEPTGLVPPLPYFDARATAHPLATFREPIRLHAGLDGFRRRIYVYAAGWPQDLPSPFTPTWERLRDDPAWTVYTPSGAGHDLMRDAPDELAELMLHAGRFDRV